MRFGFLEQKPIDGERDGQTDGGADGYRYQPGDFVDIDEQRTLTFLQVPAVPSAPATFPVFAHEPALHDRIHRVELALGIAQCPLQPDPASRPYLLPCAQIA